MGIYREFANFYDFLMKDAPYEQWLKVLDKAIEEKPLRIADIGCGTGTLCMKLAANGHQIWGIDISDEMLTIAEEKRLQLSLPIRRRVNYLLEDMTQLQLPEPMDICYSFCDSMNYLPSIADLDVTFNKIYNNLKPGGLFIFDLLALAKMEHQLHDLKNFEVADDVICIWHNHFDKQLSELHYDVTLMTKEQKNKYLRHDEYHIQKGYTIEDVRGLLNKNGFEISMEFADFNLEKNIEEATDRYFWVVKKVSP
ncbi:class I SAM-dependent DNA methyltransferase [Desulfuribacillus alkaliarsenatis]|uniref:Methyltransferase domain-containing protein n=1 Tax=Desulfuribacillus alkaliarsenatis TaxID=766136 RepID=A0A1E5G0B4_9FIRM|nr:class I SAM-dependent methyltransferase [Desulfuribacillus alkaliarsenatis]OEF96254.1 hypothetical protein BHF68_08815 [Desulfuribacillus alkaliarsenatis]